MNFIKPKFWQKKNLISFSLYPFSIITSLFNFIKKLQTQKNFKLKTICVGNIYLGGTGKTSLTIEIKKILEKKFNTVFIKKNYFNQKDEINLLKNVGKIISTDDRLKSLDIAEKKKFEVALLDDGLQQKNINYDLKILCFNSYNGIGNGLLLPAGPLRESLHEIKNYDLVFLNGEKKNNKLIKKIKSINKKITIFFGSYVVTNLKYLDRNKNYIMMCGIGNPHEFENTLLRYKFNIINKFIYPDHYKIPNSQINNIKNLAKKEKLKIITTEKDYFRLSKNQRKEIKILKTKLKIKNVNKLKKILNNIYEKI